MGDGTQPVFHRADYATAYPHLGTAAKGSGVPILVRPIPRSDVSDGTLPWPYVWLDDERIDAIETDHADLVTITGVIAPSTVPPVSAGIRPFKEHFVFDPAVGPIELSHKSRANLRRGLRQWRSAPSDEEAWASLSTLYAALVERRGLAGSTFDFPVVHFSTLRGIAGIELFGVRDEHGSWGSLALGAVDRAGTHLLHIVNSDTGLRSHASSVLMQHLVDVHTDRGLPLYLGGAPSRDTDGGVSRFKRRWSNCTMPSWLLTLVLRPDVYADLTRDLPPTDFFPAYRSPWS